MTAAPAALPRLRDAVDGAAFVLLDQWGCLHDGERPHAGARPVLEGLRAAGIPVALVSNSSRPAAPSQRILDEMGLGPDLYDAMLTAGALAAAWLRGAVATGEVGRVLSLLGPPGPTSVARHLDLPVTTDIDEADALIVSGVHRAPAAAFDAILQRGAARGVPLLCLNPDLRSVQPDGTFVYCPGAYARRYAALGGPVRSWGKPEGEIYAAARAALGVPQGRGVAIGDSLDHDILGASRAGLDSVLIARGVHWDDLGLAQPGDWPTAAAVGRLGQQRGAVPTWFQASLAW